MFGIEIQFFFTSFEMPGLGAAEPEGWVGPTVKIECRLDGYVMRQTGFYPAKTVPGLQQSPRTTSIPIPLSYTWALRAPGGLPIREADKNNTRQLNTATGYETG